MVVRRLVVAVGAAAAAVTLQAVPAYADVPNLYVTTTGDDTHDCTTVETACATVNAATFKADPTGITTIHVLAGTFDGAVRPGAFNRSVVIDGAGAGQTTLTASETTDGYDGTVVELYGATEDTLSNLTVSGGPAGGIAVIDPEVVLHLDHVVATGGGCDLYVSGGQVDATDSTFSDGGEGSCGVPPHQHLAGVAVDGGNVTLTRAQIPVSVTNASGVVVNGGTTTVDQSFFDGSSNQSDLNQTRGVLATAGTATVKRSTFDGFDTGVFNSGGTALVSDSTFAGNVEGVTGGTAPTTVVRTTFLDTLGAVYGPGPAPVAVAGSVFGGPADTTFGKNCAGSISDLGYNLSADDSCTFTETSSHGSFLGLNLDTALADRGGPSGLLTVAIFSPSTAADTIPVGATYGVANTPLCPASTATDLRGAPRPVGAGCDAGSYEMSGSVTTVTGPATAKPHADVTFDALVVAPDVIPGTESPAGTVDFTSGGTVLCADVPFRPGASKHALCATTALGAGSHPVVATFVPAQNASTLHGSASAPRTIKVGKTPAFTSDGHTTFVVGKSASFKVHASGSPTPRITKVKGKLPEGLTFHAGNGTATISGKAKASAVGTHKITLQAKNLMGTVTQVLRIVVKR